MNENIKDPKSFRQLMESMGRVSFDDTYRPINEESNEGVEEVRHIQQEMAQLLEELTDIIRSELPNDYRNLEAYLLAPLKIRILGEDSGYMSNDPSIFTVIEKLENNGNEEYDAFPDDEEGNH